MHEGKKRKVFENDLENNPQYAKHAIFTTEPSCMKVAKTSLEKPRNQKFEKFSKCFSRLESLPMRESRGEPRKSLYTPRNWTFYPWTSRHIEPRETYKPKILKNILSIFVTGTLTHQWVVKNFFVGSQLGHATGPTHDWVARTGQHCFWRFWQFLQKQNTFQKQLKHTKIFLCLINKNWACENTFNQV